MSKVLTNRQRSEMYKTHGKPILSLEFDVFDLNKVSMWAHTRHDIPFAQMKQAFEAIAQHITKFIQDGGMCPFNPDFLKSSDVPEAFDEKYTNYEQSISN